MSAGAHTTSSGRPSSSVAFRNEGGACRTAPSTAPSGGARRARRPYEGDAEDERTPRIAVFLAVVFLIFLFAALYPVASRAAVAKGICDVRIQNTAATPDELLAPLTELDSELGVQWARLTLGWSQFEPAPGVYNEVQLANLDFVTDELARRGVKMLVTICYTPQWASNQSFWDSPPAGYAKGYQSFYPIRDGALDELQATAEYVAARYAGRISAYEVWNEPNLWPYIYPQRTASDPSFAAHTYLKMLKAWSAGIRAGDPSALVVAGGTAPLGKDDKWRTTPQSFARYLKDHDAGQYFDAYSHHPYTPGGSFNKAPNMPPNDLSNTVTLYNLGQLLRLFPKKPFYLTEYGYNTERSRDFGGMTVSAVQQAAWLKKAYRYAGRYPQVKALFWFLVQDGRPAGQPADWGVYTGLREVGGGRKLSWFAYAGQNRLTIEAPRRVRRGAAARIRGALSNASLGALGGKTLVLQARRVGSGTWRTVATRRTGEDGSYRFSARPGGRTVYRVVWRGVKTSTGRTVRVG